MRAFVKATAYYLHVLLSGKRSLYLLGYLLALAAAFIAFARFHDPFALRVLEKRLYAEGYYRESMFFLRFAVLVLVVFSSVQLSLVEAGDAALWARISPVKTLFAKMAAVYVVSVLFSVAGLLLMESVYHFTVYKEAFRPEGLFLVMAVFTLHYTALASVLGLYVRSVFGFFPVLLGFLASDIAVDFGARIDANGFLVYALNTFFLNAHHFAGGEIGFLPSYPTLIVMALFLVGLACLRHQSMDCA